MEVVNLSRPQLGRPSTTLKPAQDPSTAKIAKGPPRLPLDPLRGFICLGVVWIHLLPDDRLPKTPAWAWDSLYFGLQYLRLGVESFFLIGGYFIAQSFTAKQSSELSVSRFLFRRFLRLAIPFWIVLLLYTAFQGALTLHNPETNVPTLKENLATAFFIREYAGTDAVIPYFWSMEVWFQFIVVWAVLFGLVRYVLDESRWARFQPRGHAAMQALTLSFFFATTAAKAMNLTNGSLVLHNAPYIAFGMVVYWVFHREMNAGWIVPCILALLGMGIAAEEPKSYKILVACGLVALCQLTLASSFGRLGTFKDTAVGRFFAYCGRRSFSIYLIHGWIGIVAFYYGCNALERLGMLSGPAVLAMMPVGIAASIVGGALFYRYIECPVAARIAKIPYRTKCAG